MWQELRPTDRSTVGPFSTFETWIYWKGNNEVSRQFIKQILKAMHSSASPSSQVIDLTARFISNPLGSTYLELHNWRNLFRWKSFFFCFFFNKTKENSFLVNGGLLRLQAVTFEHADGFLRGVVHSQIGCTDLKSSKNPWIYWIFSDFFSFFRNFRIFS